MCGRDFYLIGSSCGRPVQRDNLKLRYFYYVLAPSITYQPATEVTALGLELGLLKASEWPAEAWGCKGCSKS